MNALVSVRVPDADAATEAVGMDGRLETLLIEIGAIKGACQGVEREFSRVSSEVGRNSEAWRDIAVEQGALRASIERVGQSVTELKGDVQEQARLTNARIDALEKGVQPLIDWQRTGARLAVAIGGILFAVWAVFGSGVQKLGADVLAWITHRAP